MMPKRSLIFRIHRFIYFVLKGVGKMEREHYLFTLPEPLPSEWLFSVLANHGWQPHYLGFMYSGQVYQCRKLLDRGEHQYHVRIYDDGRVTGHFEVSIEWNWRDHLAGVDLRTMNKAEEVELWAALLSTLLP